MKTYTRVTVLLLAYITFSTSMAKSQTQRIERVTAPEAHQPAEVSVAINPDNPENIVVVSLQKSPTAGYPRYTNFAYVSKDNGKTWQSVANPNPHRRTQGDDAITFSRNGTAFHSYISFKKLYSTHPVGSSNGIVITRSDDGGETWKSPEPVVDHVNTVAPFEDKPWLTVDNQGDSKYTGNLYITWTRFDKYGSSKSADSTQIYFSRSTDHGSSFLMPYDISDHGGNAVDSSNTVEGAVPATGPDGTIYVAWAGPRGIVLDKSEDGGLSFGKDVKVADNPGGWKFNVEGIGRANGLPVTDTDVSGGSYNGSIYVSWIDQRYGDPDVFIAHSRDHGESWSNPVRVNNDPKGNGAEQFFNWMSVDPVTGNIYIAYYDRADLQDTRTTLTLARSTDGGHTFNTYKVNQPPFSMNQQVFFGDYLGVDAYNDKVVIGYQHFTSRDSLAVSASIFNFGD